MARTIVYVYAEPYGPRDWTAYRTVAEAHRAQAGYFAQGRASHLVETTGNSFDETQGQLRSLRTAYVDRLAATVKLRDGAQS